MIIREELEASEPVRELEVACADAIARLRDL
jgi:hypothetical protein